MNGRTAREWAEAEAAAHLSLHVARGQDVATQSPHANAARLWLTPCSQRRPRRAASAAKLSHAAPRPDEASGRSSAPSRPQSRATAATAAGSATIPQEPAPACPAAFAGPSRPPTRFRRLGNPDGRGPARCGTAHFVSRACSADEAWPRTTCRRGRFLAPLGAAGCPDCDPGRLLTPRPTSRPCHAGGAARGPVAASSPVANLNRSPW